MKLTVRQRYTKLEGTPEEISILDKRLSVMYPGVQYSARWKAMKAKADMIERQTGKRPKTWDGKFHLIKHNKEGYFIPTGMVEKVKSLVSCTEIDDFRFVGIEDVLNRAKDRARTLQLNGIELSDRQRNAIVGAVENHSGAILLATNGGKSEVCIGIAEAYGLPALWMVRTKELLHQCADRYYQRTGKRAGKIGDGEFSIGEEMTVCIVQNIEPESAKWQEILSRFKVLLVDEAAHASADTWYAVCMAVPAPFRFALTGTAPSQKYRLYRMMAATGSKIIIRVRNQELIEEGWSATPTIHVQELQYPPADHLDYFQAYDKFVRFHKGFMKQVIADAKQFYDEGKSVLIIVDRKNQGFKLKSELGGRDIECGFLWSGAESFQRKKMLKDFKEGRLPILIGTSVIDEGVDVPAINALILAAGGKAAGRQLQRVGRALRKKLGTNTVDIVDYVFHGNKYMLDHSIKRLKLYERQGFKMVFRAPIKLGA